MTGVSGVRGVLAARRSVAAVLVALACIGAAGCQGGADAAGSGDAARADATEPDAATPSVELPGEVQLNVTLFESADGASTEALAQMADPAYWGALLGDTWVAVGVEVGEAHVTTVTATDDEGGLGDELLSARESLEPCSADTRWSEYRERVADQGGQRSGIHVFVGGEVLTPQVNRLAVGGTCGPFEGCRTDVSASDGILFDANALYAAPASFAHELGHMFGLDHAETQTGCGANLVPGPAGGDVVAAELERLTANLMRTKLEGDLGIPADPAHLEDLTAEQIDRVRTLVCANTEEFGGRPSLCGPPP